MRRVDMRVGVVAGRCVGCVLWWVMGGRVWSARLVRGGDGGGPGNDRMMMALEGDLWFLVVDWIGRSGIWALVVEMGQIGLTGYIEVYHWTIMSFTLLRT